MDISKKQKTNKKKQQQQKDPFAQTLIDVFATKLKLTNGTSH